jgi:hypothetical protein
LRRKKKKAEAEKQQTKLSMENGDIPEDANERKIILSSLFPSSKITSFVNS